MFFESYPQDLNSHKKTFDAHFDSLVHKVNPAFLKVLNREDLVENCLNCFKKFKNADQILVFGIGGSSLGGKVLSEVSKSQQKVHFFENVDSYDFYKRLEKIKNFDNCHFIFISKSGSTLETLALLSFLKDFLKSESFIAQRSVVITEVKKSPLYNWAQKNNVEVLEIPLDLGGRFSVLSPVGLYPALFMGFDIKEILRGAKDFQKNKEMYSLFCAHALDSIQKGKSIFVIWAYSESLKNFCLWIQQLWSESLGKKLTLEGSPAPVVSTPMALTGTVDQHSVLQQIVESQKDKHILFIRNLRDEEFGNPLQELLFEELSYLKKLSLGQILKAQYEGTKASITKNEIPNSTLAVSNLNEYTLGQLFNFFQICVAMFGVHNQINTYDQPGVEYSKKIAVDLLKKVESSHKG